MTQSTKPTPVENPSWHALFAPLPDGVKPERKLVAPPELIGKPEAAAIEGWEQLAVYLSAGAAGLRHVLVVIDDQGQPLSASDMVLYRRAGPEGAPDGAVEHVQVSVGGRLEPDGTFLGTRWHSVSVVADDADEPLTRESTPSQPSPTDVEALKALVADVLRRASQHA